LFREKNDVSGEWFTKWKRVVDIDLSTEESIEKSFIVEFNPEWDFLAGDDPYEGYYIRLDLDILYRELMSNYIEIEIKYDDETIYFNKVNIFEPLERNNFRKYEEKNILGIWYMNGLFGVINLEFDVKYQLKIKTYFDSNLIKINKLKFTIEKRVL